MDTIIQKETVISRPGIGVETLSGAGIRKSNDNDHGIPQESLVIPYFDKNGAATDFCRWRLPQPHGSQKYGQKPGSGTRAYIPKQLHEMAHNGELVIVEGEFKSLSLVDSGIAAIGLPGLGTYTRSDNGDRNLLDGIIDGVSIAQALRVYYLGDSDTSSNPEFARYALFLAQEIDRISKSQTKLLIPRIPLDSSGKGIDDLKDYLGKDFGEFWQNAIQTAEEVDLKSSMWALQFRLLSRESEAFLRLTGAEKDKHSRRIQQMIAQCDDDLQKDRLVGLGSKLLGVSMATLRKLKPDKEEHSAHSVHFPEVLPAEYPVDGAELLDKIHCMVGKYVGIPNESAEAVALWILHTYVYDAFEVSPYLFVTSVAKRCGKTTLMILLKEITRKSLFTSNITAPALFRMVTEFQPTLIIDESDNYIAGNKLYAGILNAGHRKACDRIIRCESSKDGFTPRIYNVWCPKAIAGIGDIEDTTEDRSIIIQMSRLPSNIKLPQLPGSNFFSKIREECLRWAIDNQEKLSAAEYFEELENHRANDNWTVLVAIADLAGDSWPSRARKAAKALSKTSLSLNEMLLRDIKAVFDEKNENRIGSNDLCKALQELDGHPWAGDDRNRRLTANTMAISLKQFGVRSRKYRVGQKIVRGYFLDDLNPVWNLYLD